MTVYILRMCNTDYFKIGYTARDVAQRVNDLQTGCPEPLEVVALLEGDERLEQELHRRFMQYRTDGGEEWFRLTDTSLIEEIIHVRSIADNHPRSLGGTSAFDVRPLRGRQLDPTASRGKDVPQLTKAIDVACRKPVLIVGRRKH